MGAGLWTFDSAGNQTFGPSARPIRYTGVKLAIGGAGADPGGSGSYTDDRLAGASSLPLMFAREGSGSLFERPTVTVSGSTATWQWPGSARPLWIIAFVTY